MNKKQTRECVKALQCAKTFLWDGVNSQSPEETKFICYALNAVQGKGPCLTQGAITAKNLIMTRLGYSTVEVYLQQAVKVRITQLTYRNTQTFRHLWLDALIKELSA